MEGESGDREMLPSQGETGTAYLGDPFDGLLSVLSSAEACPIFYGIFGAMALGSPMLLDLSLFLAKATEPEKAALRKIQDCYNEAGFVSKVLDAIVLVIYLPHPTSKR